MNYKKMIVDKRLLLAFQPVSRIQIARAIDQINPSKSAANDEISMKLIRKIRAPLIPIFQHLVNTVVMTSTYPTVLKYTKIVPLLKKYKDQTLTSSYRGVNLIPSVAKIVDKCLLIQLLKHIEDNQLIPHQHHGGISGLGTATALTTLVDSWALQIESGQDAAILIMDESLAYDLVDHKILTRKLEAIGLDPHSLNLMRSYLKN